MGSRFLIVPPANASFTGGAAAHPQQQQKEACTSNNPAHASIILSRY
jgi:hypothetical protein